VPSGFCIRFRPTRQSIHSGQSHFRKSSGISASARCRVCVHLYGQTQYYQRDSEQRRDGRWVAVPFFVINRPEAVTMGEAQGRALIDKIRSLGWRGEIWIETHDGRRIDVDQPVQESAEDNQPVIATLDDQTWYIVKPIVRPAEGRMWFVSIRVPCFPVPVVLYAKEPLAVLQKAHDLNYLQFLEVFERPQPQQQAVQNNSRGFRRRPGDY
jgi:hypothetical protein